MFRNLCRRHFGTIFALYQNMKNNEKIYIVNVFMLSDSKYCLFLNNKKYIFDDFTALNDFFVSGFFSSLKKQGYEYIQYNFSYFSGGFSVPDGFFPNSPKNNN